MELGERVAKLEQRVDTQADEMLRIRDSQHDSDVRLEAVLLDSAHFTQEVRSYIANSEKNIEQAAHRVYARIKREEREAAESGSNGLASKLTKIIALLVTAICALVGVKHGFPL